MKKILVAVDGSKISDKALMEAKKLGLLFDSEITILYVIEDIMAHPYVHIKDYDSAIRNAFKEQGVKIIDDAMKKFKDYTGKVETIIENGNPGNIIIKITENKEYDLIVMGSRGLDAVSRVMLGSVSNKVLNNVDVSVLIVK